MGFLAIQPVNKENMLKLLLAGVSVESLIEGWVYAGFESGEYSLDTALLLKGPLAIVMANMAEEEGAVRQVQGARSWREGCSR